MGSNQSNGTRTSTTTNFKKNRWTIRKKRPVDCSACFEKLDYDHKGIRCDGGHHLCINTCAKTFMNTVLEEPQSRIPAKCPICNVVLRNDIVERALESKQLQKYQYHQLRMAAGNTKVEGEVFCACPFCDYFEYQVGKEEDILFMSCKDSECGKTSCVVCKSTVHKGEESESATDHTKCHNMRKEKSEFEQVLAACNSMPCPECKLAGMKDIQCSHIICPRCHSHWCYVCGKKDKDLGLQPGESFYNHFRYWQLREDRCPPYLQSISQINGDFPNDGEAALQKFHENRSKVMLKKFMEDVGIDEFSNLRSQFQSVENCGFTTEEIKNAPAHVFRPPPNLFLQSVRGGKVIFGYARRGIRTLMTNTVGDVRLNQFTRYVPAPVKGLAIGIAAIFLFMLIIRLLFMVATLITVVVLGVALVLGVPSVCLVIYDLSINLPQSSMPFLLVTVPLFSLTGTQWLFLFNLAYFLVYFVTTITLVFGCIVFGVVVYISR